RGEGGIASDLGRPVEDLLRVLPTDLVLGRGQRNAEPDVEARLLLDLAHRRLGQGLPGSDLALRPGPVVVLRTVDEDYFEALGPVPPAHGSRGEHIGGHPGGLLRRGDRGRAHASSPIRRRWRWRRMSSVW